MYDIIWKEKNEKYWGELGSWSKWQQCPLVNLTSNFSELSGTTSDICRIFFFLQSENMVCNVQPPTTYLCTSTYLFTT